jgi:hypothetical protein
VALELAGEGNLELDMLHMGQVVKAKREPNVRYQVLKGGLATMISVMEILI